MLCMQQKLSRATCEQLICLMCDQCKQFNKHGCLTKPEDALRHSEQQLYECVGGLMGLSETCEAACSKLLPLI
jgi:hypothetical protein